MSELRSPSYSRDPEGDCLTFGFPAFWGLIRDGAAPSRLIDSWGSWKLGSLIQPLGFGKLEEQMEPFDLAYLHTSVLPDDSRNISVMLVDTHLDRTSHVSHRLRKLSDCGL